ncbi:MAG: ComF family protein [Balneolaceae bacterium]|nr:ComF family protein [Balneolaceae bacterium]
MTDKFEEANLDHQRSSSDTLLPEGVYLQHALWNFDKGGELQDLLHSLKYNRLPGVGVDLGRQLGKSLKANQWFKDLLLNKDAEVVLIPVPLHWRKRRKRGYNQAYYIAKGVAEVMKVSMVGKSDVLRKKNTKTQTGFTLQKRKKNMEEAFSVANAEAVKHKICVIIDDVFTTGATTFELASTIRKEEREEILIATVAQA